MFFGSNSPSSYSVKASAISNLIYSSSKSYIVFDNLIIKGANEIGFDINSGSNIQIKNCDVLSSGVDGVNVSNHQNFKIENCTVSNSYNNGIVTSSSNVTIRNNTVKNTYTVPGMGPGGDGKGIGISVNSGSLVEYNKVINTGYIGIKMDGNNVTLKNNYIDSFCYIKDDGGGVYTYNKADIANYGRKIIGNIIINGKGAPEGTNTKNSSAHGIYLDLNINGIEITGNTIASCQRGIFLHNSRDIIVRNNTFYNNNDQIMLTKDGYGQYLKNHTITKNILFSKLDWQRTLSVNTNNGDNDIKYIGRLDSNYFARPLNNTKLVFTTTYLYTSGQKKVYRDLPNWKSTYNKDILSKLSTKTFTSDPDANIKFEYNATQVSKTVSLAASYIDVKNNRYSNSITLQPFTSIVLIKDGVSSRPATENTAPSIKLNSPANNSNHKAPAAINITATAFDADGTVSKVEFFKDSTLLYTTLRAPYSWDWTNAPVGNYLLTAKATDNKGKVSTSEGVRLTVASRNQSQVATADKNYFEKINFKLFPNPAVNSIKLTFDVFVINQKATLTIQNVSGSILKRFPVVISDKSLEIDVSSLTTGMFVITLAGDNFKLNKKFTKIN